MPFTSTDILFICAHSVCGILGIVGNAALLVAIKYRSPSSWKSYTILLTNCALIDLLACFCSSMSIERTAPFKYVTASVYLGPCTFVSGFFCHCLHATLVHTLAQSLFLIVIAFYYRLYVIGSGKREGSFRAAPTRTNMIIFCTLIYLPTFVVLIVTFFTNDPPDEVRKALSSYYPNHDQFDGYIVEGHDVQPHLWIKFVQAYMILPIFPLCIIVFVVRRKVIDKLRAKKDAMTTRTIEMHNSLVKVLTLQASLPILFLTAILTFFVLRSHLYVSAFLEFSILFYMSLMPSIAPFITLYNVKPLRNFVLMRQQISSKSSAPSKVSSTKKQSGRY